MARPNKTGLDYFPFDVDFFADEKIAAISGEFGIKGEITVIKLLCAVYRNGYFILWNEPMKYKMLRDLPGVSAELIDQIVNRLVRWGFFDEGLFDSVKVLTSIGIQKRYFSITRRRAVTDDRFILVFDNKNRVIDDKNTGEKEFLTTKTTQSKVKKMKENNSTPLSTDVDIPPSKNPESDSVISKAEEKEKNCAKREKEFYDQLVPYVAIYGSAMIRNFFDYWSEKNKSRSKMRYELQQTWDLAKRLKTWENKQKEYEKRNSKGGCDSEKSDESLMRHIAAGYARGIEELRRQEH